MDTRAVADAIGTDSKLLRRFLRDKTTSFIPCGSGSRYSFTPEDVEGITREFGPWQVRQAAKAAQKPAKLRTEATRAPGTQADRDAVVWAEDGPVTLEDIRVPRVRAIVRERAQAAEDRLNALLLAKGLHVSQMRDRAAA